VSNPEEPRRARFCIRGPEECDGIAEPEEDGEVTFFKCVKCEQEFGYQVIGPGDPECQLGIPAAVRGAFEFVPLADPAKGLFLGSAIRVRRAEDDAGA